MAQPSDSVHLDVPDFSNSVLSHLNRLRLQGRLCDIVVSVEGQGFRAHKVVLAASSPYFRDHMALGQMSTVSLGVIRKPRVFEQLLSFCYTGRLSLQLADIISYLTAASFLQMQHVIDRCTQLLEGIHLKIHLGDAGAKGLRGLGEGQAGEGQGEGEEKEPRLTMDHEGQWYVESSGERQEEEEEEEEEEELRGVEEGALQIKTERMEEWIEEEEEEEVLPGGGAAEEEATMLIDRSGRSSLVQEDIVSGPSSSQKDRVSPTDSVVILNEHQRAKSESPGRDDAQQPSSQGEEPAALGGYEEYLREQVGDRWFRYNPRLTCIYCCKSFNQKGSLDRHMRLHMGITPFVCRICGKKYTRKDQLEYHIRKHTGNKPFHCHLCGKSFPFQAILNQHFRKNHPGCTPQDVARSASPETTTAASSSRAGQYNSSSPSQEHRDGGGTEGPQASVSTTGPD